MCQDHRQRRGRWGIKTRAFSSLRQYHWFSIWAAHWKPLGDLQNSSVWALTPRGSDLIDLGCSLLLGIFKAPQGILVCSKV